MDDYRDIALWAFGERCGVCAADNKDILIHHISGCGGDDILTNLIPLCRSCHQYAHHGLPHPDPEIALLQSQTLGQTTIPPGLVYDYRRGQWWYDGEFLTTEQAVDAARAWG